MQNKRPSRSQPATLSSALTYHGVPARRARALRTEADSGVEVEWRRLCAAAEQEPVAEVRAGREDRGHAHVDQEGLPGSQRLVLLLLGR